MSSLCGVSCSCCMHLMLSLKMDKFLISGDLSSSLKTLFKTSSYMGCHLDFAPFQTLFLI